jgi:glycerol uptake facilitator-like aquaporin
MSCTASSRPAVKAPRMKLSTVSALWLVVPVYFLGDISAHFNPATTLAFACGGTWTG